MSQSIDDRLGGLLKLYISGSCNYEEYQELLALLKVQSDDSRTEELLQEEIQNSRYHADEENVDWQQMLQTVLQQKDAAEPAPVRRLWIYRVAAAAAVIIILGTIAWWWLQRNNWQTNNKPVAMITDVMPGKNGAILTLANGRQFVLDSTGNGDLYTQAGVQIVKHDSLIEYNAPASKSSDGTGAVSYNTLTTPKGRQFQVVLADGTRVWLNASSSIRYPAVFSAQERRVDVTGEVYFEVAKDPHKPFKVSFSSKAAGNRQGVVEVLGTHFNINAYDDEVAVRTTLLEGKIKTSIHNGESSILKPGEQAVIAAISPLTIDHSPNVDQVMAWKNGYFQFDRVDIKTVMRQISRWYDVEIVYDGPVTNDRFGGSIPRDATLSQVLNALEQSLVHFTIQGKKVIVTP
jgi:transmembrane sensor